MLVKLEPALKSYLWGGEKLGKEWGKAGEHIAEAWELSFHPDGPSRIVGSGALLKDVAGRADWGKNCETFPFFPVLTKLIDAAQPLSVQVHPTDEYALAHEGQFGKTEMWHILGAEEGSFLYLGLKERTSPADFEAAVRAGTVCELLNRVPVKAGDTYFIPGGTIHAIGAGITLFEIQQSSSLTYRVYDYGRLDRDGNPRPLHVEKAMKVIEWGGCRPSDNRRGDLLGKCPYFSAYALHGAQTIGRADSFVSLTVTGGELAVGDLALKKGDTVYLSAGETAEVTGGGDYILICVEGSYGTH